MRPRRNRRQCEFAWCEFACTSSTWRSWWSSSSGSEYRCDRSRASSSVLQTASFTVEPHGPTADVEDSKEPVTQRAAGPRFYPGPPGRRPAVRSSKEAVVRDLQGSAGGSSDTAAFKHSAGIPPRSLRIFGSSTWPSARAARQGTFVSIRHAYYVEKIINLTSSATPRHYNACVFASLPSSASSAALSAGRTPIQASDGTRFKTRETPGAVTRNRGDGPSFLEERGQRASRVSGGTGRVQRSRRASAAAGCRAPALPHLRRGLRRRQRWLGEPRRRPDRELHRRVDSPELRPARAA